MTLDQATQLCEYLEALSEDVYANPCNLTRHHDPEEWEVEITGPRAYDPTWRLTGYQLPTPPAPASHSSLNSLRGTE